MVRGRFRDGVQSTGTPGGAPLAVDPRRSGSVRTTRAGAGPHFVQFGRSGIGPPHAGRGRPLELPLIAASPPPAPRGPGPARGEGIRQMKTFASPTRGQCRGPRRWGTADVPQSAPRGPGNGWGTADVPQGQPHAARGATDTMTGPVAVIHFPGAGKVVAGAGKEAASWSDFKSDHPRGRQGVRFQIGPPFGSRFKRDPLNRCGSAGRSLAGATKNQGPPASRT